MATATYALTNPPLFLQKAADATDPISYTAAQVRLLIGTIFPRTGITGGGSAALRVQPRAEGVNASVDVTSGVAILGNSASGFDRYLVYNQTKANIPLTGFNTSPTAVRTHAVWIAVYDGLVAGSEYTSKIVVTEDTGGGAPTPADSPAFYLQLATFTLGPSQSTVGPNNITNVARHAQFGSSELVLSLAAGIRPGTDAGFDGGAPTYSISGSKLCLAGIVARTTGNFDPGDGPPNTGSVSIPTYNIGTLPEGFRPKYNRYVSATGEGGNFWRCSVFPSGAVVATVPLRVSALGPGRYMSWISLDGIQIELD